MNPSSTLYEGGIKARRLIEKSREMIAEDLDADPEQIIFTSGSTEAANMIINSFSYPILTEMEHPCIFNTATRGSCEILAVNNKGDIKDPDSIATYDNSVLCLTDVNNETGHIVKVPHIENCKLLLDMTQTMSKGRDIKRECDYAFASAHKFGAFRGVGFIYARDPDTLSPILFGGHQEKNLRAGTENTAGIYAMARQFRRVNESRAENYEKMAELKKYIIKNLPSGFSVHDFEPSVPGIISLSSPYDDLVSRLALYDIYVSAGSACSTGENKPSRILKAVGFSDDEARRTVRISLSSDIKKQDLNYFLRTLDNIIF